jgi:glucose-fructose oxidoreductase
LNAPHERCEKGQTMAAKGKGKGAARSAASEMGSMPGESKDGGRAGRKGGAGEKRKIRYAVVGLGHIAQAAMLPAFAHAKKNSELAALVTEDRQKLEELGERYQVGALYDYAGLRRCLAEESIDAVYIATPNTEHERLVVQAAEMGVHVLCEKPLGASERECMSMIRACEEGGVKLMTAYRLHFEAANLRVLELLRAGKIGEPRVFSSVFSYQIKDEENIRLRGDLGGGPLHDIGIYCINAARSVFGDEPIAVHAWSACSGDPRFAEVDETVTAQLLFSGGRVANFVCSFGIATASWYQVLGTKGSVCLEPAYDYSEPLAMSLTIDEKTQERQYAKRDQFAAELLYFSKCILEDTEPEPSGWEGLADVRVIRAIEQSMERGMALEVPPTPYVRHPSPRQRIDRPPVPREPKLVHARSASE